MSLPEGLCFGARDRGLPLPERLRTYLGQATGWDFADVRVHLGNLPERNGAVAFNHGSDLYFSPQTYNPASAEGLRLIGHELAHVVQQREGRVRTHGGCRGLWFDAGLEREADDWGARLAAGEALGRIDACAGGYRWDLLQATLKIHESGGVREFTTAEEAYAAILANVRGGFRVFFVHVKRDILPILREWITARGGDDKEAWRRRAEAGERRHILEFQDYTNLARAVMGEFLGGIALEEEETPLARQTLESRYVWANLDSLLEKINLKVGADSGAQLGDLKNTANPPGGPYQPLYRKQGANIPKVLASPEAYYFEDKIVTLHDVMNFLQKKGLVSVPAERSQGSYFTINDLGYPEVQRRPLQGTADFRFNEKDASGGYRHFTLKENSGFVMAARVAGMPIWAGPSFTTGRLMQMCDWAGAGPNEFEAMAWGIFAFWNQCYPETSTWTHRFHAVMDMAANYGVHYVPFSYPKGAPPNNREMRSVY